MPISDCAKVGQDLEDLERSLLESPPTFATRAGMPPVAVALVTLRTDVRHDRHVALLDELYVVPTLRGKGIGSAAMGHARACAHTRARDAIRVRIRALSSRDHAGATSRRYASGYHASVPRCRLPARSPQPPLDPMDPSFKKQCTFMVRLGEMLHKYGTPAFRLEAHLKAIAAHLSLDGYFLVSPTTLTFCLWVQGAPDDDVYNYSMRVKPGDLDLGSLARADALVNELVAGRCTLEEARVGLEVIERSGSPYPEPVTWLAFVVLGSAFSMLMRGSWHDVMWSGTLSTLVYALVVWSGRSRRVATMLEPLAATLIATIAVGVSRLDPGINQPLVVLSSLIIFVPGLSLAMGFRELAARELISGTGRIMDSLMVLFKLYFGTVLGLAAGVLIWGEVFPADELQVPPWTVWPSVLLLASGLAVVFKARLVDVPWGIASGVLAYGVSTLVTGAWGITLGAFLGAFVVGVYANLFARWRNAPAALVTLPGIVVLVPGSKLYVGLDTAVSGNRMTGVDHVGVQTFLLFMSLIAGLVFASAVVEPRRAL